MRGLPDVSSILLDEADFFPLGQGQDARDVLGDILPRVIPSINHRLKSFYIVAHHGIEISTKSVIAPIICDKFVVSIARTWRI